MRLVVSPLEVAASLSDLWSPRVIAEVDEAYVKVARVRGEFGWHAHADEDELFLVLRGRLRIDTEQGARELGPGEMTVIPKGLHHNPSAGEECLILLLERKSTRHSGDSITPWTRSIEQQLLEPQERGRQ